MANRVLQVAEQLDIEVALRLYLNNMTDRELELQYGKEQVKRIEQLLKELRSNRLAVIGVY